MGQEQALPPVTITQILKATLRHRPTRILLGEVRDAAAWDLLQLLNTGHGGSMSTLHANNAQDALYRLAELAQTAKLGLPLESTFFSIGRAIDVVVHVGRVGKLRCVTQVITVDRYSPQDQAFTTHTLFDLQKELR
jgi:pilus assembly protein CpaF